MPTFITVTDNNNSAFIEVNFNDVETSSTWKKIHYRKSSIRNVKLAANSEFIEIVMYDDSVLQVVATLVFTGKYSPITSINGVNATDNSHLYDLIIAII